MESKFTHRNAKILNSFLFSPKSNRIAAFRNTADMMLAARVVAARCQNKIIRKAVRILETSNIANPRKQGANR